MKRRERSVILGLVAAVLALGWFRFFQARSQSARVEIVAKEVPSVRQ